MSGADEPIRVLHVEDDPDLRDLVGTFLEREEPRITVHTAGTAETALEILSTDDVDCIVSDYDMPGRNGIELLEAVRAEYPSLPFILYTGKGSEEVASEAISKGVDDYLQKERGTGQYAILANRITNVVARTRAVEQATQTRAYFGTVLKHASDYVMVVDETGRVDYISPAVKRVLGYDPGELEGVDAFDLIHPDDQSVALEGFAAVLEHPDADHTVEYRARHADGSWRWLEVRGRNRLTDPIIEGIIVSAREVSDRRAREAEFKRRDRRYRAVFNDPNILVGLLDTDGMVLDINETALSYVDSDHADLTGEPFWETPWFAGDEGAQERVREWIGQAAAGEYVEFEIDLTAAIGAPLIISGVFRPVRDEDGEVVSLLISDRDVTEQREHERQLEQARELLDRTERIADVGGWEIDTETMDLFWTDTLFELAGVEGDEEPSLEEAMQLYHEADRPIVEGAIERALDSGEAFDVEVRFHRPDGEIGWLEVSGVPTLEDGEVLTLRGAVQDITEQRRREERLQKTTSRLEALFENSPDMIDVLDPDGTIVDVNRRFCEELGVDAEQLIGTAIWEIDQLVEETDVKELLADFAPDERRKFEGRYERHDGSTVPVEVHLLRLQLEGAVRFLAISRDITERTAREQQLEQQNRQLEQFASVISHDLRNPLTVAQGRLDLAREEFDSEDLDVAAGSIERSLELIDDVLTLSREGKVVSELQAVTLGDLVGDCWANVDTGSSTLAVDGDITIEADRSRLRQLLENLFRNAIDHGGAAVTVRVGALSDGFYVEDDGPGIPPEERDSVFDPGYTNSPEGTGFGLQIVKRIAEGHGWTVTVTDGPDGGARFEFGDVF